MHPVIEALVDLVEAKPVLADDTSAFWQELGRCTVVQREGNGVRLRAAGFEAVRGRHPVTRVFRSMERLSYRGVTRRYAAFPEVWRHARQLVHDIRGEPTFTVLKSACALAVLTEHWQAQGLAPRVFVLIGDGQGFLGALIRRCVPGAQLFCIDLPQALVFQACLHELAGDGATMAMWAGGRPAEAGAVTFLPPAELERIPQVDCAINIASMQEMTQESIARYFHFLRGRSTPSLRFYCVNRLEKLLPPAGEVIRFMEYPWQENDRWFIDEPCPYYTHFVSPKTRERGPRLLGWRIPCVNTFDGLFWHRLAWLAPNTPPEVPER